MRRIVFVLLALLALTLLAPAATQASSGNATIYVVHGIPGKDLGLDPALPVDVSVNGACAITNFTFGTITDGIALPAGDYTLAISLANAKSPCGNAPVIGPVTVPFAAGQRYSVVAHLTASGGITAGVFPFSTIDRRGQSRVVAHHTAAAPAVDIGISRPSGSGAILLEDVTNGVFAPIDVRAGAWKGFIAPANTSTPVFEAAMTLKPRTTYLVFAVGSLTNGTFTVLMKAV